MQEYLILKLEGPLQAWGGHTFEDRRPSELFPTRSGLLGLLAACLGIDRTDVEKQQALATSVSFAVRVDNAPIKMIDYHTVKDARKEHQGLKSIETIQTWREYLQDAKYTVAIWLTRQATVSFDALVEAINRPVYTPFLGRRSCPITRPLFADRVSSVNELEALVLVEPDGGTVYSECLDDSKPRLLIRDVPISGRKRQFATRQISIHAGKGGDYVP
ncbi:MAG: type I-E CRISPR-associated protein Cas5/CasD [Gammaproteobacteria bacterium]|nr:type I-E CRISPR-associated protein Cas5/CasD [Gammaproteobacteria bacterium]